MMVKELLFHRGILIFFFIFQDEELALLRTAVLASMKEVSGH